MPTIGVLVMAYGGPENLGEVGPYLMDVRGGRPTPPEIVQELRERYRRIGGRSPILERTREQAEALEETLNRTTPATGPLDGVAFTAYVGMRHWRPTISEALARMADAGIQRAVGLVMAPHYSRISVGAYLKTVDEAQSAVEVASIERWHLLPGYLDALAERVRAALGKFPARVRDRVPVLFTAHSLPRRILEWEDPYPRELEATVEAVVAWLEGRPASPARFPKRYHFAYQSAGKTTEPWLGPDAAELIQRLAGEGERHLLIAPVGFICDHIEVLYDVDIAYREHAAALGVHLERTEMLNASPLLIAGLAELVRGKARERGWV